MATKKYCDVTGLKVRLQLHAQYTDPPRRATRTPSRACTTTASKYTRLFADSCVRGPPGLSLTVQGPGVDNAYLALRGHASQLF